MDEATELLVKRLGYLKARLIEEVKAHARDLAFESSGREEMVRRYAEHVDQAASTITTQAAQVTALEAEVERLKGEDWQPIEWSRVERALDEAEKRGYDVVEIDLDFLRTLIADHTRLREALEPFAKAWESANENPHTYNRFGDDELILAAEVHTQTGGETK
jgi:hypothetical protein